MLDAYSFDKDEEGMVKSYQNLRKAFLEIFEQLGLKVNTNGKTRSIAILGNSTFSPSDIYCNGEKIKYYSDIYGHHRKIYINITFLIIICPFLVLVPPLLH